MSQLSLGNPNSTRDRRDPPGLHVRERILYHQIHPVKLATDWVTGLAAAWLLWDHLLLTALLVGFVPSIVVSIYMILKVDLARYRDSAFGRYLSSPSTRPSDGIRFFGLFVMWGGAWLNMVLPAAAGLAIILFAWLKGLLVRKKS